MSETNMCKVKNSKYRRGNDGVDWINIQDQLEATIIDRKQRYGDFYDVSVTSQGLKNVMIKSPNWKELSPDKKEALEMVVHKISRILNGDPEFKDSWLDIAGYIFRAIENLKGTD